MTKESYFSLADETYFMAHSELAPFRYTLLFIHGLGDSHINYLHYLSSDLVKHFNLLIPDLLGYGKSSSASDYTFQHQIQGIMHHLEYLQITTKIKIDNIILIAHSMGGIHATLLCESAIKNLIKGFINVEGSVTQYGSFISQSMIEALKTCSFDDWFADFKSNTRFRPYNASLEFCHPEAFRQNATEMYHICHEATGKFTNSMGKKFVGLDVRKVYCYGNFTCKETLEFLNENNVQLHSIPAKTHFLLAECPDDMVNFIKKFGNHKR
jgi:pimeloyl-ACP methyl ester carboxylesterase